jgi:uncharacterized protein YjiS (DUF1127 family)
MEPTMTDAVIRTTIPASGAALRFRQLATLLASSLRRTILARATRRALGELPDDLLKDVGLTRGEIPFVARALACEHGEPTRARR